MKRRLGIEKKLLSNPTEPRPIVLAHPQPDVLGCGAINNDLPFKLFSK